ncbi:MAG: P-type conjugative transfer protein VirB9 [Neisseriaceae bacterium]|nr:P-type conjugative transfer protein VirB9 [Neisseriaceae bacterium]
MNKRFILPPLAVFLLPVFAMFSGSLNAATTPKGSAFDGRIQKVAYNPDDVVKIRAKIGYTVTVQLDKGENVEQGVVALGDAQAWNMAVKGNNLIFKPTATSPKTNLTVITDKRTYLFDLNLAGSKNQATTYLLRFSYPDDEERARQLKAKQQARAVSLQMKYGYNGKKTPLNYKYFGKGDKKIAPTAIWDDLLFTYIQYADNRDLPAVYKVNPDGSEMLVNTHIEDDVLVIHETAEKFVLRLGNSVLGIRNGDYKTGKFNRLNTSKPNAVRINKGEEQ